jgi:hypothetical protein
VNVLSQKCVLCFLTRYNKINWLTYQPITNLPLCRSSVLWRYTSSWGLEVKLFALLTSTLDGNDWLTSCFNHSTAIRTEFESGWTTYSVHMLRKEESLPLPEIESLLWARTQLRILSTELFWFINKYVTIWLTDEWLDQVSNSSLQCSAWRDH